MKGNLFHKITDQISLFLRHTCQREIKSLILLVRIKHGVRFDGAVAIPCFRQVGQVAKSLHRPVARNGIKTMLPMKGGSGK